MDSSSITSQKLSGIALIKRFARVKPTGIAIIHSQEKETNFLRKINWVKLTRIVMINVDPSTPDCDIHSGNNRMAAPNTPNPMMFAVSQRMNGFFWKKDF